VKKVDVTVQRINLQLFLAQRDLKALSDVAEGISKKQDISLGVLFTHLLQEIGITFGYER
jgi:hypothetical protein